MVVLLLFFNFIIDYLFFFSYSNFLYKMGGIKGLTKWVFMGYFVVRYEKV